MTGAACAEMSSHAKEQLDKEVCGVLVGEIFEDEHGRWVSAMAAIRGTATEEGGTHVTYTQETWAKIYEVKDRDYPKLDIVGWYHSHPGFGVEFSDMDKFIQENFFAGPMQFALVIDPLGGDEAICVNTPDGISYVGQYWVDGRQRKCRVSAAESSAFPAGGASDTSAMEKRLQSVEDRLSQLLQADEEDRLARHRVLLGFGFIAAVSIMAWIGWSVYDRAVSTNEPPELIQWVPVPVRIDDQTVMLGVAVAKWQVPPSLNAAYVELERQRREAEQQKLAEEGEGQPSEDQPPPSKK